MPFPSHDKQIDYIEFGTTDMGKSKAFYREAFGWTFTDYGEEYASFEDGRLSGGFRLMDDVTPGGPLVILYATDLEMTVEHVANAGGTIIQPIFEFPGGRRFHFADPAGNVLAVWSDNKPRG
jgi:predicted enzyme related to lactoylglutathione lyase